MVSKPQRSSSWKGYVSAIDKFLNFQLNLQVCKP